jgi:hypothetical protein
MLVRVREQAGIAIPQRVALVVGHPYIMGCSDRGLRGAQLAGHLGERSAEQPLPLHFDGVQQLVEGIREETTPLVE